MSSEQSLSLRAVWKTLELPERYRWRLLQAIQPVRPNPVHLTAKEALLLSLARVLIQAMRVKPLAVYFLLQELQRVVGPIAEQLERIFQTDEYCEVPAWSLAVADGRYVTWPGLNRFWDLDYDHYVPQLPEPAVFASTIHVPAMYFKFRKCLEIDKIR